MDAVLGTAGHIDHGKTSLVRALTGINCDRLDEEKRRGITIELGFAWMDLPDGRRLGIVDVPGHEKFVKNMVAGAAGIDCMLLVVAADEGVMPQTREHLDICSLLGIRSGLVVLTKTDMVDAEWLELAKEDVREALKDTFLENAPIFSVSSATGQGIEELRKGIFDLVSSLSEKSRSDILRLPVDRVFTLKGFGTVVTGTVVSGECGQGEDVCLMPGGRSARARSLQVHSAQVEHAHSGQRCAINLQNLDVTDIARGDVVTRPGCLFASWRWIARLTCLPSSPLPIRQRMETHFHHGSKECAARIIFRDRDELQPGQTAIVEIHFSEPMAGIFGDHFVLRAHSPLRTIAGGVLLDPLPAVLRTRDPLFRKKMEIYQELADIAKKSGGESASSSANRLVELAMFLREAPGVDGKRLAALTGLRSKPLEKALAKAAEKGEAVCWDKDGQWWVARKVFDSSLEKCIVRASELHEREPLKSSFAPNALYVGWGEALPPKYTQKVLDEAIKRGLLRAEGNGVKLASHEIAFNEGQESLLRELQEIFQKNEYSPPYLKEILDAPGMNGKTVLSLISHLCENGKLAKVQDGLYYSQPVLQKILEQVRQWFTVHESLDVAGMKTMFGISRKYAIPLLEYMDSVRLTLRVGNERKLLKKS